MIEGILEALVFSSGEPVTLRDLAAAAGVSAQTAEDALKGLAGKYRATKRGILMAEINGSYQMYTNPLYYEALRKLREIPARNVLTQALMETLAIIAYKQPVTKAQIEEIRGVNPDHAVGRLMEFGLIAEDGRMDTPGKPILFRTSDEFVRRFALDGMDEMMEIG